ncbi:MAG: class I SAM-dependent methyltransferase [Deltaproteobacteria bacterium]|nr:class I SAM-dependent methyltransferase [Nannocystaceae bacterium]
MASDDDDPVRRSWNVATRNHNAHKGDQAARLAAGEELLFEEELALLGDLEGRTLVHLQCNSGQDSLCLARLGARVTGVDLSDEAIAFAQGLSERSGIPATFVRSELVAWMEQTEQRFELAFASYGAVGWLPDISAWARGVARILVPGGRLVYVEFHPLVWSFGDDQRLCRDDYFQREPFIEPVGDYVADSGDALGAIGSQPRGHNDIDAPSWQWTFADVLDALAQAGLVIERVQEYPWSNGCRVNPGLVRLEGTRRWVWPEGVARVPLMFGIRARRPL